MCVCAPLSDVFRRMEMPSQRCLALLELNGVGFSVRECERQKHVMQAKLIALEGQAYALAGCSFSLTSMDDIAQVSDMWTTWSCVWIGQRNTFWM